MIMKKISKYLTEIVCVCALVVCTCFGMSYKANKIYASDLVPITEKQRLGAFLSSLAFSCGVKFYVTTVETWEWLVDNFNYVMLSLTLGKTANDVYQNANDNFDSTTKTYTLDPEFTEAVQEYLKYLQGQGLNEYSGTVEVGNYTETTEGTYYEIPTNTMVVVSRNSSDYAQGFMSYSHPARAIEVTNQANTDGMYIFVSDDLTGQWWSGSGYGTPNSGTRRNWNFVTRTVNGKQYGICDSWRTNGNLLNVLPKVKSTHGDNESGYILTAIDYCYGNQAVTGGTETIPVMGEPNRYMYDTYLTLDRPSTYTVDYSDTDGAENLLTLDEIVELVNSLIDTGTQQQQQTIPQTQVQPQSQTIDPTTVQTPLEFQSIPTLVDPQCETLGACLVNGVTSVSSHLQSIYNSNESLANYTKVSLAIGLAFLLLGVGLS